MRLPDAGAIRSFLNDPSLERLEASARQAAGLTRQYFGRAVGLYTPLYVSNHCASRCIYCGFHRDNPIPRRRLEPAAIEAECRAIAASGVQNLLLLTGESPDITPPEWLAEAVGIAKRQFQSVSLEVYPMDTADYRLLYQSGADGVTLYQETYDQQRYAEVHLDGKKRDYAWRREGPARAARAGMRQLSLGILLGLGPLAEDLAALYGHLRELEKTFPGVEYSLSFPRLRTIRHQTFAGGTVDDITFVKILCLTRSVFPRVGINLSTREPADFRDRALELAVTRVSIGSRTTVGGYHQADDAAPQFDIADERSAEQTIRALKAHGFDPVFTDWRGIENS